MNDPVESVDDVRDDVLERTEALLATHPPTNPKVLLNVAEWWYDNGKGASDPIFQMALAWTLATHSEAVGQADFIEIDRAAREYAEELGIEK